MLEITTRIRCLGALPAIVMLATGCQRYHRSPLHLDEIAERWSDRQLDVEPIRRFATSLAGDSSDRSPFDIADGVSLHEAEAVALHFNPQLRLARATANIPLAGAKEAGWWPDPRVEMEVLRFVNRGDKTRFKLNGPSFDGLNAGGAENTPFGLRRVEGDYIDDPWIVGAGLSITIPVSGRLAVEKDLRWSQYSAAWRRILVKEWQLITELRNAWLVWSSSSMRLAITRDYIERLETIGSMAKQLVSAGEMKPTEGRLLVIELARRRADNLANEREEAQARHALFTLMGIAPNPAIALHPSLANESAPRPADVRREDLVTLHPLIKSARADYEVAEQQLRLEIRKQYPDLDVGPSYSLEEGFSRMGLGVGFPIPLWNRNRQAVAEAFAAREAARVQAEVAVENVLSEFALLELRLKYTLQRRKSLLETVAPLVEKQVEDSRTLLGLGEVDVVLLRDALIGSLDTKLALLEATVAEGRATNELTQMLQPRWFTPSQVSAKETEK